MTISDASPKYNFDAVIFDLDGVITKTASVHAESWKVMFNEYLRLREQRDDESFQEFSYDKDYLTYLDGKPRYQGVQSFLESRGIDIPFGEKEDAPDQETVCGLGNKKNVTFRDLLEKEGVEVYEPAVALLKNLKAQGIHVGVASSSKNCQYVLQSVGLNKFFETRVDGIISVELGLKGKPDGDIFITAAKNVGAVPQRSVVVEDAVSGVQAGRNGGFGLVIGVARENNEDDLKKNGADVVIKNFKGVDVERIEEWFKLKNSI